MTSLAALVLLVAPAVADVEQVLLDARVELHRLETSVRDAHEAGALVSGVIERLSAIPPEEGDERVDDLLNQVVPIAYDLDRNADVERGLRWLLAYRSSVHPPGDGRVLAVRGNLATVLNETGQFEEAAPIVAELLAVYAESLPPEAENVLRCREQLVLSLWGRGRLEEARDEAAALLADLVRVRGERDPFAGRIHGRLGLVLAALGDHAGAVRHKHLAYDVQAAILPPESSGMVQSTIALSTAYRDAGDLERALEWARRAAETGARGIGATHAFTLRARLEAAECLRRLGRLELAQSELEALVELDRSGDAAGHDYSAWAGLGLVRVLRATGEVRRARNLAEEMLSRAERSLPADHPDRVRALEELASLHHDLGDLRSAEPLIEAVVASYERTRGAGDPDLVRSLGNLALVRGHLGRSSEAIELHERVVAELSRRLPDDHPEVLRELGNFGGALNRVRRYEEARAVQERVLAALREQHPGDHRNVLIAKFELAGTLREQGELEASFALSEDALRVREERLSPGDPFRLDSCTETARMALRTARRERALELLEPLADGLLERLEGALLLAPREAQAVATESEMHVAALLHLSGLAGDAPAVERGFEVLETLRHAATAFAGGGGEELASLRRRAGELRRALNDVVTGEGEEAASELARLARERDTVERAVRERLVANGAMVDRIGLGVLAAGLEPEAAAVGFFRYERWSLDPETPLRPAPHLLAHVVRSDRRLVRVELGAIELLETAVRAWREEVGQPLASVSRGLVSSSAETAGGGEDGSTALGRGLREVLLDPVLEAAGRDVRRLHVVSDDALLLVPLDALPYADGSAVGDRIEVVNEVSFARLLADRPAERGSPALFAMGGPEFGPGGSFAPLPQTALEVAAVAAGFERRFSRAARVVRGAEATREALWEGASGARFLHLATHGWFDPGGSAGGAVLLDAEGVLRRAVGMAPMTLCGLALAGANEGPDATGRVRGLVTAEELAGMELAGCELAVLSACETNAGIRRAGQGIQSLQTALHAAGARSAITSLWRVDDAATRELFERFYTYLWVEGMAKSDALWKAKGDLRDEGHPVRDWAAWVLSGDPD